MSRVEGSYPTPIHGISTLKPRNRATGQATTQTNFRSDPVNKLNRRPPLKWDYRALTDLTSDDVKHHSFIRDGKTIEVYITDDGELTLYEDGVILSGSGDISPYMTVPSNLILKTIGTETIIVDTTKIVEMFSSNEPDTIEKVSHINVLSALNYGETVQVNVTTADEVVHSISYTIPDLGITNPNFDAADKARATKQVALEIASRINSGGSHEYDIPNPEYTGDPALCCEFISDGGLGCMLNPGYDPGNTQCAPYQGPFAGVPGVTAIALGSTVAVWEDANNVFVDVGIETGQGERSCVAVNATIESVEGLPLYAVVGTRIKVQPDPSTEKGVYWLESVGTSDHSGKAPSPDLRKLEEVIWTESKDPTVDQAFNGQTMPHRLVYPGEGGGDFGVGEKPWTFRRVGDDDSNPLPDFVGTTISAVEYFQKRLVFASGVNVNTTQTDSTRLWWQSSVLSLLVTDPVRVATSATDVDDIKYILPHNKDMLFVTANGQFKLSGAAALTPQTVALTLTTKYEVQVDVEPVSIGNDVYLPVTYGDSSGLLKYTGEANTQQESAISVSLHVLGYMPGKITHLTASANLNMLAVTTDGAPTNTIFVLEMFVSKDKKIIQEAWSEWTIPDTVDKISDIKFLGDSLIVYCIEGTTMIRKSFNMYSSIAQNTEEVLLDDWKIAYCPTGDGFGAVPDYTFDADTIIVAGEDSDYPLNKVPYTIDGGTIVFDDPITADLSPCYVYYGQPYRSGYTPTRPYVRDEKGIAVTTDRLRVSHFHVEIEESHNIAMHITSDYVTIDDQEYNSRILNDLLNIVGEQNASTGTVRFSYAQDADLADAEFYTEGYFPLTISGISWLGQTYKTSRRM